MIKSHLNVTHNIKLDTTTPNIGTTFIPTTNIPVINYNCEICSKLFKLEEDLEIHKQAVHGKKSEVSHVVLPNDQPQKKSYDNFTRWECNKCDKVCRLEQDLELHKKIMHMNNSEIPQAQENTPEQVNIQLFSSIFS